MRRDSIDLPVILLSVVLLVMALCPDDVLARAGGGGGGGGRGGILNLILLPFFIIYSMVATYLIAKKHRESERALMKAEVDHFWKRDWRTLSRAVGPLAAGASVFRCQACQCTSWRHADACRARRS